MSHRAKLFWERLFKQVRSLLRNDPSHDNIYTPRVVVIRPVVGIIYMQVCAISHAGDDEILRTCNDQNPSGTTSGWGVVKRDGVPGEGGPIQCNDCPDRVHLIVGC